MPPSANDKVFIRRARRTKRPKSVNIGSLLKKSRVDGEIGLEIEMEGNKFPKIPGSYPDGWTYCHDGSLRGNDNAEYVLTKPVKFSEVKPLVDKLYSCLKDYGTVLDESNRTSVHVHLNAQSFYLNRLCSFMAIYFCLEEVLTQWCGEHRVGNLFCLRAKDAPGLVNAVKEFIQNDGDSTKYLYDGLHYAGLNAHALSKFGSLEIRSLRGVSDPEVILQWVEVLRRIYELSAEYPDPRDFVAQFSATGPMGFFEKILGALAGVVKQGCGMSVDEIRSAMYAGVRIAQDLCYCRDWSLYKPEQPVLDPFGREVVTENAEPTPVSATPHLPPGWSSGAISDVVQQYYTLNTVATPLAGTGEPHIDEFLDSWFVPNPGTSVPPSEPEL